MGRVRMKKVVGNNGVALLMVLWVLMLLTVIVGEFCYFMKTRVNITRNFKESTQAYYIARAGLNRAIYKMVEQQIMPPATASTGDTAEEDAAAPWRINTDMPAVPFGDGEFKVSIENEAGKININRADAGMLRLMLSGFDLDDQQTDEIVDSIMDWRDKDSLHRANGAEEDYYESLPKPYKCRNGDFESVAELLLVRGVTPEIFYNGLEDMVTVFTADDTNRVRRKTKKEGYALNINAMPSRLWAALPGITDEAIAAIHEYRQEKDFQSVADLQQVVGPDVYGAIARYLTTKTLPYYTVRSIGMIPGSRTTEAVEAVIRIDNTTARRFRVIKWVDQVSPDAGRGGLLPS